MYDLIRQTIKLNNKTSNENLKNEPTGTPLPYFSTFWDFCSDAKPEVSQSCFFLVCRVVVCAPAIFYRLVKQAGNESHTCLSEW